MKKNSSFPHPVLGINQGVEPDLGDDALVVNFCQELEDSYIYNITLKQENYKIQTYIDKKQAEYICEVDCSSTLYKRVFRSYDSTLEIKLMKHEVRDHVDFHFYVVTNCAVDDYYSSQFNEEYVDPETGEAPTFQLEAGSILVVFPEISENIKLRFNNKPNLNAFIQVVKGMSDSKQVVIDVSEDIINIELPLDMYRDFEEFNIGDYRGIFYASLVFNALVKGILNVEEYKEKVWADSIRAIMEQSPEKFKGMELDDPADAVDIATAMLTTDMAGSPYDLLFESIKKLQS